MLNGCSVVSATQQPDKKNLNLFVAGTPRDKLISEFGTPAALSLDKKERVEIFSFADGYSLTNKAGRAIFHGIADIGTIGFWEFAGTPLEGHFDGTNMLYQVTYDALDRVENVSKLKVN